MICADFFNLENGATVFMVTGALSGQQIHVLLDTGAGLSFISEDIVEQLKLHKTTTGDSWVAPSRPKVSWSRRACVAARPGSQEGPQGCTVAGRLLGEGVALLAAGRVGRWRAAHLVWLPAAAAC